MPFIKILVDNHYVKKYKKNDAFLIDWMNRTVHVLPIYIHQEDIKRKQIMYKKGRKNIIQEKKGINQRIFEEYPMLLNTLPQAGAYRSYASNLLQMN